MKEKLINNLGLKILSIFLAFFVWLIVVNVSNPEVTRTKEVTLEIENEKVLTSARLTYELLGKSTVTVSYDVRARDEYKIRSADFRAYIDLADLYDITGSVPVKVEAINNKEILFNVFAKTGTVQVKTEELQRKRFDLTVVTTGEEEEGYKVETTNLDPMYIFVEGPTSLVGQINYVGIGLDLTNRNSDSADNTGTTMPVFYDANGTELNLGERVTTNVAETGVNYEIVINRVKSLNLDFRVSGDVASGYRFIGLESDIKAVSVQGLTTTLAEFNTIMIPAEVLSIQGATNDRRVTVDLQQYLPEGVSIVGSATVAEVLLRVEKLETRRFVLDRRSLIIQGADDSYQYVTMPEEIELTVQGLKEELDTLKLEDIGASVDVTGFVPDETYPGVLTYRQSNVFDVVGATPFQIITTAADDLVEPETVSGSESSAIDSGGESDSAPSDGEETTADHAAAEENTAPESMKESEAAGQTEPGSVLNN